MIPVGSGLLNDFIVGLNIEERGRRIRTQIERRFGQLPDPGPERGEYFKAIKRALPERGVQNLAARLLKGRPLVFADVAAAFPSVTPGGLSCIMDNIEAGALSEHDASDGYCREEQRLEGEAN